MNEKPIDSFAEKNNFSDGLNQSHQKYGDSEEKCESAIGR